jgi:hypothetical protein
MAYAAYLCELPDECDGLGRGMVGKHGHKVVGGMSAADDVVVDAGFAARTRLLLARKREFSGAEWQLPLISQVR